VTETTTTTTEIPAENEVEPAANKISFLPPTISPPSSTTQETTTATPKNPRFTVNLDVTVRDGSDDQNPPSIYEKKSSLYEKYNRKKDINRKKNNPFFLNKDQPWIKEVKQEAAVPNFRPAAVLGANPERIRSYGGRQLSQSDFERSILGVSTATEISVKSIICVKGQCFNADEKKYK
jgi:hypothetical protein